MPEWRSPAELKRLWRYYQAGIVNLIFGYCMFALLIAIRLEMYVAQVASHLIGMAFNYFTYSRYTFADSSGSKTAFIVSYVINYVLSVIALTGITWFVPSPYAAGLLAAVIVSLMNFFLLKHFVFRGAGSTA